MDLKKRILVVLTGIPLLFSNCLSTKTFEKIISVTPKILNNSQFVGIGFDSDSDGVEDCKAIYQILYCDEIGNRALKLIGHYKDLNKDGIYSEEEFVPFKIKY